MTTEELIARQKRDAEIDARSRERIKLKCRFCKYRMQDLSNDITKGCDYFSHAGKLRKRAEGNAGDCLSFEPFKKETKAERIARSRRNLILGEADRKGR